jgi:hypothetical protein
VTAALRGVRASPLSARPGGRADSVGLLRRHPRPAGDPARPRRVGERRRADADLLNLALAVIAVIAVIAVAAARLARGRPQAFASRWRCLR